ncbi:MAG TPA: EAL domain-containing protein [Epulopiscium sp.]|nr:EAL domain-containing protein [Candidatus Epulonipiscium sp.]
MFIARQPIFNKRMDVFGYELLFRLDSGSTQFGGVSSQEATATVVGGLFEAGINNIVEDKYAFINFDEYFIHSNSLEIISPDRLIIEILEDVKIDDRLIKRLQDLRKMGYKIALDDFVKDYKEYPLVPLARIIKFDLLQTPLKSIEADVKRALIDKKIILAEKVETKKDFLQAKEMGFHLFQGYFFSRPNIVSKAGGKTSSKTQYTRMLWELKKSEPSYDILAGIIEKDVNLAYRFMRVISYRSKKNLIDSIKKGLTYMGLDEIEKWISILMFQDIGKGKPKELVRISLIRTKFAEEITVRTGLGKIKHEASMMGLFSTLDALLDQTMEEALRDIALTQSIKDALIRHKGELYTVYKLLIAYEKGDWDEVEIITIEENIDANILSEEYLESIKWANEVSVLMA